MSTVTYLSIQQLSQAVAIREQIESLEHELNSLNPWGLFDQHLQVTNLQITQPIGFQGNI
jgi:hypothetical protein